MKKYLLGLFLMSVVTGCNSFKNTDAQLTQAFRNEKSSLTYTKEAERCFKQSASNVNFSIVEMANEKNITNIVSVERIKRSNLLKNENCIVVRGN